MFKSVVWALGDTHFEFGTLESSLIEINAVRY